MLPSDLKNLEAIGSMIYQLTQDEGDSVTICHPNPDFGLHNATIFVEREFAPQIHYSGDSVFECLQKAIRAEL